MVQYPNPRFADPEVIHGLVQPGVKYERTLFEPEHELFRESYRAFLERHVAPFHEQWEKDKIVDRGVWLEAGKQGFLGMAVPEEYGGGGNGDFRYNVVITEETGRRPVQRPRVRAAERRHAPYFLRLATDEQKQRWLPGFCSGELITAIAMTEPGTGSDLQGIKTRAVKRRTSSRCSTARRRSSPTASTPTS